MRKLIIIAAILGCNFMASAQTYNGEGEVWFLLLNHYKINEKWTVGNELHWRRTDGLSTMKQFIFRPFVNFKPGESTVYSAGYSFITTHPYGKFPRADVQPEHNVWEQVTLNQKLGKTSISHRYRMEHRFQGDLQTQPSGEIEVGGYDFSHRFRYRLTVKQPLGEDYFFHGFDELWVSIEDRFNSGNLSQNWLYLGLGRNIPNGNIQVAYLRQHSIGAQVEKHHSVQFTVQYDF
ncbi:MAG: DUF2490 domain-containing protein [Ekhidna sp.]